MRTGMANLPLHYGKAPPWLFEKMKNLAREITIFVVSEFGPDEMLKKLSDPFWFQAFGSVLGFDWHSSGLTTTVCGALKEALKGSEKDFGLFIAGGKGRTSRKTPSEIEEFGSLISTDPAKLVYASKMAAKVDNNALQDGYQLYHHTFIFTAHGSWSVIQQGMNPANRFARRYHWLSHGVRDFVCEPHSAICGDKTEAPLNMVARESEEARKTSTLLAQEKPAALLKDLEKIKTLDLPARHEVLVKDVHPERIKKIFLKTYERKPENFEQLLGMEGVGAKTIRALTLISELVYGTAPSFQDPVKFSFAHGGKDGYPYPVDKENYENSIEILTKVLAQAKLGSTDKLKALKKLNAFYSRSYLKQTPASRSNLDNLPASIRK